MAKQLSIALLAAFGILAALPASAQSTFGSLRGSTQDATGAAIPGAAITLTGLDDNSQHQTIAGEDGVFEFLNLKPGRYTVIGQKPGFADAKVPQVVLEARQDLRVALTFAVASQSQTVEVQALAEQMNTENATLSDSKGNTDITQLPINSRSVSSSPLAALAVSAVGDQGLAGEYCRRRRDVGADRFFGGWNFDRQRAFQRRAAGRLPIHGKHRRDESHGVQQQCGIRPDRRRDLCHQERNQSIAWQRV